MLIARIQLTRSNGRKRVFTQLGKRSWQCGVSLAVGAYWGPTVSIRSAENYLTDSEVMHNLAGAIGSLPRSFA